MELAQATGYFGSEQIEGWNGTAWEEIADLNLNLHAYDRFLGPRAFGQKQRLLFGGKDQIIPSQYELVRLSNGDIYIILSHNQDLAHGVAYDTTYVVQKAPFVADLIEMVEVPAPSGIGGTIERTSRGTVMCDMDRYTAGDSEELPTVRYTTFSILMPASAAIDLDYELEIAGDAYQIIEISPLLQVKEVRARRGGDVV